MALLSARAGRKAMVYGGEKKSRSTMRARAGIAWKDRSAPRDMRGAQSGRTSF